MKMKEHQAYDLIGDIHGHADELHWLLETLGYDHSGETFHHPERRKVIFLGDYIDRGPKIRSVLETVRGMVENGDALAILGNHEVNAMRYGTLGSDGQPLRPHSQKNTRQHSATLDQFPDRAEWKHWLDWFAGLPLWLDLGVRAVHACWDAKAMRVLSEIGRLEGIALESISRKGSPGFEAASRIVNGPEALLPEGHLLTSADGNRRAEIRVKWWVDLEGLNCRDAIFPTNPDAPALPAREMPIVDYPADAPPTFFGHYALRYSKPGPIRPNIACLDYATGKGGFLCAYRWDGETVIDAEKFVALKNSQRFSRKTTDDLKAAPYCPL